MQETKTSTYSIKRIIRRIPIVQRLIGLLVDLDQRVRGLEGLSRDQATIANGPNHAAELGELIEILDTRIMQVRKDIELALAPTIHQIQDRIAQIEVGGQARLDDNARTMEQSCSKSDILDTRVMQVRKDIELALAPTIHQIQDRIAQLEVSRQARLDNNARTMEQSYSKMAANQVHEEWRYLKPKDVVGVDFVRVGRLGDGGYIMLNDFADCQRGISIGVGEELSWDLQVANKGIGLVLYDHTIENLVVKHDNISFRHCGGGGLGEGEFNKKSLPEIITAEGLDSEFNMLMKIDIEGDEWAFLKDISPDLMRKFSQVVIEFHGMADFLSHQKHLTRMYILNALAVTHQCVHLHANNWGDYKIIGGLPVPDVIEATFASRDRYTFRDCARRFPTPIDYPNNADRAELVIIQELISDAGEAIF